MKLYFASRAANWRMVRHYIEFAQASGHEVTHDWTVAVEAIGDGREADVDVDDLRRGAHDDRAGVFDCQTFVNIWHPDQMGALIETGMAIALGKYVWVAAESVHDPRWNIFWELPQVEIITLTTLERRLRAKTQPARLSERS